MSLIAIYSNEVKGITFLNVFFGKFDIDKDLTVTNQILLLGNFFMYSYKLDKISPLFNVFKAKLRATYKLKWNSSISAIS